MLNNVIAPTKTWKAIVKLLGLTLPGCKGVPVPETPNKAVDGDRIMKEIVEPKGEVVPEICEKSL